MSFSFSSLIRLLVLMAVGATMMAVGLSRLDPPRPDWRTPRPASHTNVNEYFLDVTDRTPHWLDADTGQVVAHTLEDGDVLEAATCSPWVDEKGNRQVIGRWSSRTKAGPMSMSNDFGLARYTFPGGKKLDHVSTETVPVGPPCWYPGTGARILFAAGDGMLYHYAFEPEPWIKATVPDAKSDAKPRPVAWRCDKPGDGDVFISEVTWPDDPRMGGCVVASLREQRLTPGGTRAYSGSQLWWLKLNFAGTVIVECGRLLLPADSGLSDENDERSPAVGVLPDGKLVVAYLMQRGGKLGWELRVAPIVLDSDRHVLRASLAESWVLADGCQPAHPSFSSDGRWINAISGPTASESQVTRFSTSGLVKPAR